MDQLSILPRDTQRGFSTLSGGNQQKAIVAKWLATNPKVLLMHEPTAGVDVASRAQIYSIIREEAERGLAVVVSSSDVSELLELCDRILVFDRGVVHRSIDPRAARESDVVEAMHGWKPTEEGA
jgi:ribose transport system ATP-binding protein